MLCLPELCISGYGCEDQFFSAGVQQTSLEMLGEIVPATRGMVVCVGLPVIVGRGLYNGAALMCDGELLGIVLKQHLAGDGLHYEPRWFRQWPCGDVRADRRSAASRVPVGDLLFDCGGVRIGIEICRDAWVADRPGARLAAAGADVMLNPTASHFAFAKQDVRRRIVLEGSRTFHVQLSCSPTCWATKRAGRSSTAARTSPRPGGWWPRGRGCRLPTMCSTCGDVDVGVTRRLRVAASAPSCPDGAFRGEMVRSEFALPAPQSACPPSSARRVGCRRRRRRRRSSPGPCRWRCSTTCERAAPAGSSSRSAAGPIRRPSATLVWLMVKLGVAELGREEFAARLAAASPDSPTPASDEAIVGRLLTCVYQATRNSGETTRRAAATVAEAVGAEFHRVEHRRAGRRLCGDRREGDRPRAHLGPRRRGAAKHAGPGPRPRRVAAGQSARRAAARHEQPQRGGRRLRDDGRRHLRRTGADRGHRQGVPARVAPVDGADRARWASGRCRRWRVDQRRSADRRAAAAAAPSRPTRAT